MAKILAGAVVGFAVAAAFTYLMGAFAEANINFAHWAASTRFGCNVGFICIGSVGVILGAVVGAALDDQ